MVEELKKLQNNIKKKKDELDLLITKNANENDIFLIYWKKTIKMK